MFGQIKCRMIAHANADTHSGANWLTNHRLAHLQPFHSISQYPSHFTSHKVAHNVAHKVAHNVAKPFSNSSPKQ